MRINILTVLILLSGISFGQDTLNIEWKLERNYSIDSSEVWTVDALGNVFIAGKDHIEKYDSVGVLKFEQSIKSLGSVAQFESINTMKLVHFSTEQQTICFFDNTLTKSENCIDLGEYDIYSAGYVATSVRSDKIWILDNLNSKLLLFDINGNVMQMIETENLKGVLDLQNAIQIIERNSRLYVLDKEKGIFVFDIYGSLIELIEFEEAAGIDSHDNWLFILKNDIIYRVDLKTKITSEIVLPVKDVQSFRIQNEHLFLRTSKNVHKYSP